MHLHHRHCQGKKRHPTMGIAESAQTKTGFSDEEIHDVEIIVVVVVLASRLALSSIMLRQISVESRE